MADQKISNQGPEIFGFRDLAILADEIFGSLAAQFPVCMASDEFHFFPQARAEEVDWSRWDDFSTEAMTGATHRLTNWSRRLDQYLSLRLPSAETVDADMLRRVVGTLCEQLTLARVVEAQPTFYLTIVGIGLAEAYEAGSRAFEARLRGLPEFLGQAVQNLNRIPRLFRDLGIEMLTKQNRWLSSLPLPEGHRSSIMVAYRDLAVHLKNVRVDEDFLMPVDLYERVAFHHIGCLLKPDDIDRELKEEIKETRSLLKQAAESMAPGRKWQAVVDGLPLPALSSGGAREIYRGAISELARHCMEKKLVTADLVRQCPVAVEGIPEYMRPVRSNAAFSMPPVHPPRGGTFFIFDTGKDQPVPTDYRLLAAHETYPGHHLLDTSRWNHERPIRRHIEFPIFYEGWASFSEELMFSMGFFSGPGDRMLMAKRRFWRAMRGKVDFDIHMRRQSLDQAADFLASEGMDPYQAKVMVRRYSLKPGYQLAYTLGRRRFRRLYETFCSEERDPAVFGRRTLAQGEIGFKHLEQLLRQGG